MKRSIRAITVLALTGFLVSSGPALRAEEASEKTGEPPNYQNPIVSLLFLPVTVLLKIAEVVSPDAQQSAGSDDKSDE